MESLPERIKYARERRGWTANRLGVEAGLAQGMIYRLESGERTKRGSSGDTIGKIARALKVRVEWLLTGEEPMDLPEPEQLPARSAAAAIAREGGVHEQAIAAVLAEEPGPEDAKKPTLWWIDRMRRRELDLMSPPRGDRTHERK